MTAGRSSSGATSAWQRICSGVGYHLDNLGRRLIVFAPSVGAAYAALLAPRTLRLTPRPGWRFGEEYYDQRQWLACRRGALWEAAREWQLTISLTVPWHGGTLVDVTLGNDNSLCLYVCGSFEPNEFSFVDRVLRPGMVFLDVGANDGYYTLFAARRVGAGGMVIAVEPSSRERTHLQRNITRNGIENVQIVASALGSSSAIVDLHLAHGVHAGHNTLGKFAHDDVVRASSERVRLETLDSVVIRHGISHVDFIKIDVEGSEAGVVEGARTVLKTMRPVILMELNDRALCAQGQSVDALIQMMRDEFSYSVFSFSPTTGIPELPCGRSPLSANVTFVPMERVDEIIGVGLHS